MKNRYTTLALILTAGIGMTACTSTHRPTDLPPGEYSSTKKMTNSEGTNTAQKTTTKVGVDRYGNKTATVEKETTTDPEGLFNKRTTTTRTVVNE